MKTRTFDAQSARPHVFEVHELRNIILTQVGLGGGGRVEPSLRDRARQINKKCLRCLSVHSVVTAIELGYIRLGYVRLGISKKNKNKIRFEFKVMYTVQFSEQ